MAKTYRDVEVFEVRIHDLQFEEAFIPIKDEEFQKIEVLNSIKTFLHIVGLRVWAAGKMIQYVPGIPKVRPAIWYVRVGFGKFIPCSTNKAMDEFNMSLALNK